MISGIPEDNRLPRHMREMKPMLFGFTVLNIETDEDFQDDFQDTRRTWHVTGRVDPKNYPMDDLDSAQEAWEFACYQFIKSRLEKGLHMPVLDFDARVTGRPQKLEEFSREESEEDSEEENYQEYVKGIKKFIYNYSDYIPDAEKLEIVLQALDTDSAESSEAVGPAMKTIKHFLSEYDYSLPDNAIAFLKDCLGVLSDMDLELQDWEREGDRNEIAYQNRWRDYTKPEEKSPNLKSGNDYSPDDWDAHWD